MLPVWDLKISRPFANWDVVALFNWSESETTIGFDFAELGLEPDADYILYEFWTQAYQGVKKGHVEMPVPGHGVRLLAVHRAQANPQFISSDRHVTQGAVELTRLTWNASTKTLAGTVKVVKDSPLTLRFRVPSGYAFIEAKTIAGVACKAPAESVEIVAVTLTSPVSQDVPFSLSWK